MEELIVEEVVELIEKDDNTQLKVYLDDLNISDVEHLIDELPQYAVKFLDTLAINRAVNVFRILDFPTQERIIKKLSGPKLAELINLLPPDDRTSLFSELKGDAVAKLIQLLPATDRVEALSLLGYEEDSVGRLMTPDYVAVKKDWSVARCIYGCLCCLGNKINNNAIFYIYICIYSLLKTVLACSKTHCSCCNYGQKFHHLLHSPIRFLE